MQYIRENEAEELLEKYRYMRGMAENIRIQMKNLLESSDISDDDIISLATKHLTAEDVNSYSEGTISDRTAKTAINYEAVLNQEKQEALAELRKELLLLEVVISKIDTALSAIPVMQKDILTMRYCEKLVFAEIADKLFVSASKVKQRRKEALNRFCPLSRITMDEFEAIMRLFA